MMLKKIFIPFIAAITVIVVGNNPLHAVSVGFGGTVAYERWDPAWNKKKWKSYIGDARNLVQTQNPFSQKYNPSNSPVFGSSIKVSFTPIVEVGLSFKYSPALLDTAGIIRSHFTIKQYRLNGDIQVALNKYLGMTGAVNFNRIDYNMRLRVLMPDGQNSFQVSLAESADEYGPQLGIRLVLPVLANMVFRSDMAGKLLWGFETPKKTLMLNARGVGYTDFFIQKGEYYAYGISIDEAIEYLFPSANTMLTLSFQYQFMLHRQHSNDISTFSYNMAKDHRYGISFAVRYIFDPHKPKRDWIPRPE